MSILPPQAKPYGFASSPKGAPSGYTGKLPSTPGAVPLGKVASRQR